MVDESPEPQDLPQWLRGRSGCMLSWSQTHRFLHIHSQILPVWAMVSHVQDMYVRTCVHSINGARPGALLSFMRREQSQTLSIFVAQSRHMCFRHLALKTWNRLKKKNKKTKGWSKNKNNEDNMTNKDSEITASCCDTCAYMMITYVNHHSICLWSQLWKSCENTHKQWFIAKLVCW